MALPNAKFANATAIELTTEIIFNSADKDNTDCPLGRNSTQLYVVIITVMTLGMFTYSNKGFHCHCFCFCTARLTFLNDTNRTVFYNPDQDCRAQLESLSAPTG